MGGRFVPELVAGMERNTQSISMRKNYDDKITWNWRRNPFLNQVYFYYQNISPNNLALVVAIPS